MITCRYFEKVRKIRIKNSTILLKRNKLSIEYFDNHHSDIPVYHKYFQMVYFTDFFFGFQATKSSFLLCIEKYPVGQLRN